MFYPDWSVSAFSPLMLFPACVLGPDQLQWLYPQWPKRTAGCWCGNLPQPLPGQPWLLAQLHCRLQQWQVSGFLSFGAAGMHPNSQLSRLCHPSARSLPQKIYSFLFPSPAQKKKIKPKQYFLAEDKLVSLTAILKILIWCPNKYVRFDPKFTNQWRIFPWFLMSFLTRLKMGS